MGSISELCQEANRGAHGAMPLAPPPPRGQRRHRAGVRSRILRETDYHRQGQVDGAGHFGGDVGGLSKKHVQPSARALGRPPSPVPSLLLRYPSLHRGGKLSQEKRNRGAFFGCIQDSPSGRHLHHTNRPPRSAHLDPMPPPPLRSETGADSRAILSAESAYDY